MESLTLSRKQFRYILKHRKYLETRFHLKIILPEVFNLTCTIATFSGDRSNIQEFKVNKKIFYLQLYKYSLREEMQLHSYLGTLFWVLSGLSRKKFCTFSDFLQNSIGQNQPFYCVKLLQRSKKHRKLEKNIYLFFTTICKVLFFQFPQNQPTCSFFSPQNKDFFLKKILDRPMVDY